MQTEDQMTKPIRVLVASSDNNLRTVLCWTLAHDDRFRVVGQAIDGDSVLACRSTFDVALIDLAIHGHGVLGVLARLQDRVPVSATVVIAHTDSVYLRHAVVAEGAVDCLVMPEDLDELTDRLVAVSTARPLLVNN
jgi:DNA-binding NtrC family response regulator